jgi:probable rRNA maturation factor
MDRRSSAREFHGCRGGVTPPVVDVQIAPAFAGSLSEERLRWVVETVLRAESTSGQLAVVITDDMGIQELNRDFLDIDEPTDVLAFSAQEEAEGFVSAPEVDDYLGDVIVSYPRAVAQAQEAGHATEQELALLVIHGLLHLLGYDHADDEERAAMWVRQEAILACLPPSPVP